jgi:hypothetical protein
MKRKTTWLLFCVQGVFRVRLFFVHQRLQHEMEFKLKTNGYGVRCEGDLFGKRFTMEADSRARLPGDTKDATKIQFAGRLEHEDGPSGDFTIRSQANGELMSLDLYGAPTEIRAKKTDSRAVQCPLEIHGLGVDIDFRLESANDPWHPPAIRRDELPARPAKRYYAGFYRVPSELGGDIPPAAPVLTTFVLAHELILSRHYLDPS